MLKRGLLIFGGLIFCVCFLSLIFNRNELMVIVRDPIMYEKFDMKSYTKYYILYGLFTKDQDLVCDEGSELISFKKITNSKHTALSFISLGVFSADRIEYICGKQIK